jgi:hypothetical protein
MKKQVIRLAIAAMTFVIGIALTTLAPVPDRSAVFDSPHPPPKIASQIPSARGPATSSIAETIHKLQQFRTENEDIPSAARPLLTRLKHQLRDFISAEINTQENRRKSAELLQASILSDLRASGVTVEDPEDEDASESYLDSSYTYGTVSEISIQRPHLHPELLAVTTTLGVRCGSDTSIYLFKKTGAQWDLVLAQEANGYEDVSGAQGMFDYAVSPPDAQNNFFVVTMNVNPWCTSNWQSLRYSVLRIGPNADQPQIMAKGKEEIYLGVDVPYKLSVGHHWFSINFEGDASRDEIMNGEINTRHVVKYIINGEKVINLSK